MKNKISHIHSRAFLPFSLAALIGLALAPSSGTAQQILNGGNNYTFAELDFAPFPFFLAYGENQNGTMNLVESWITAGEGVRLADSAGSGTNNIALINIDEESRLSLAFDQDGLADILGYDGTAIINVDGTLAPVWGVTDGNLRTQRASMAVRPGSSATVNLFGQYASWNARSRHIDVGISGTAEITITDGARLYAAQRLAIGGTRWTPAAGGEDPYVPEAGGSGFLTVDGPSSRVDWADNSFGWLRIGRRATGVATVSNGALLDLASNTVASGLEIHVGDAEGGDGSLIIQSGGVVRSNGVFRVNSSNSDRGYVRVDGAGSLLDIDLEGRTSVSFVGNTGVVEGNVGILEIVNGGRANFSSSLRFGNLAGAVGQLLVDGPGSEITIGNFIQAGWNGTGSFRVSNGGTLNQLSPTYTSSVGRQVGSHGTFVIDGAGSKASFSQSLFVATGDAGFESEGTGTGVVQILDGGLLEVASLLAVRGEGSILLNNGTIRIGENGELSVAGPNTSLSGEGLIEGNLLVGNLATIAGTGDGIVVDGILAGNGAVENLTVGGVRVASQVGPLALNNVGFGNHAVITVAINDSSDANGLLEWDANTSLAGVNLDISIETFITDPDWAAQILPAPAVGGYGFASVTVPEGWSFADGLLSVSGDSPPPPPPAIISEWVPETNSVFWRSGANWSEDGFPDDGLTVARFGSVYNDGGSLSGVPTTTVTVHVGSAGGTQDVGAIVLGSDNTVNRRVRHNVLNTRGALAVHGVSLDIEGRSFDSLLLANFSQDNSVRIQSWASTQLFDLVFMRSGVIHVENPNAVIRSTSRIYEPEGTSVSITKTGEGILNLGVDFGSEDSDRVSITGDMILQEGILENTYSGAGADGVIQSSPYGFGNLILQGGNVRSTTSTGRSIFNNVILDGTVAFGSPDPAFNGNQTVSTNAGGSTTLASNSAVVIHDTTTWEQGISGEFGLAKLGPGTLIFTGEGGGLTYAGTTVVEEGVLQVNTALWSSPLSVLPGATLAFGTASEPGEMFAGSSLTLSNGSNIAFRLEEADLYDSMIVEGPISLGGASLELSLGYQPDPSFAAIVLVQNISAEPVAGVFSYEGNVLLEGSELTVTTGEFVQEFVITYQHNGTSVALLPLGGISSSVFGEWAAGFDLTGDDATPEANPAGDGFTNLEKFSFGVNPNVFVMSLADVSQSGEFLFLRWNRSNDSGISYQIDRSTDLVGWLLLEGASPSVMAIPDVTPPAGYERVEWSVDTSTEGLRAFYRVQADVDSSLLP